MKYTRLLLLQVFMLFLIACQTDSTDTVFFLDDLDDKVEWDIQRKNCKYEIEAIGKFGESDGYHTEFSLADLKAVIWSKGQRVFYLEFNKGTTEKTSIYDRGTAGEYSRKRKDFVPFLLKDSDKQKIKKVNQILDMIVAAAKDCGAKDAIKTIE